MKSKTSILRDLFRNIILSIEYFVWLLFDVSKFKKIEKRTIKKIIIIHTGAIGEVILATVLLPSLKKAFNCEIVFMVSRGQEEVLKNNPYIVEILVDTGNFKENVELLKKRGFDLAIILYKASLRNSLMCFMAKIQYRVGVFRGINGLPSLFYTRRSFLLSKKHAVEKNLDALSLLDISPISRKIEFFISKKEEKSAKRKLKNYKIKSYIVVHPGFGTFVQAKYPTRFWPMKRYAEVIDWLTEQYPLKVLLSGSKEELQFSKEIISKLRRKKDVIITNGKFNIGELAYIVSKSKLLIGPSTGVTHLAEAFNIPIVELAGKGDLFEWHPWMKKEKYRVLYHEEVCTGCNLMSCERKTIECMKAITSKEVIKTAGELLKNEHN